jgi:hypothetical protein
MAVGKPNSEYASHTRLQLASVLFAFVLCSFLALQIILIERDTLAKQALWRPAISQLCVWAGCQLSSWRQPEAFITVQQSIQVDPEQADVLIAQVSFKNTAQWPQPWPQIELALTDINGQTIALRRFNPKEYLNKDQASDIKANQLVSVEIALQETTSKAVGFHFKFN